MHPFVKASATLILICRSLNGKILNISGLETSEYMATFQAQNLPFFSLPHTQELGNSRTFDYFEDIQIPFKI